MRVNATSAKITCKTPCQKSRQYPQATWHFIGQIQSNKTKDIATHFDVVHGLASEKIARRLNDARPIGRPPLKAFIQVNLVNESAKNGVVPEALPSLVTRVQDCQNLQLLGLMAMPPATFDLAERHRFFSELAGLQAQIKADFDLPQFQELSMGMSDDLEDSHCLRRNLGPSGHSNFRRQTKPTGGLMTQQLTFIGGGNIALAIYGGLLDAGYPPQSITVSDPSPEQGALATAMGLTWQADNASAIEDR